MNTISIPGTDYFLNDEAIDIGSILVLVVIFFLIASLVSAVSRLFKNFKEKLKEKRKKKLREATEVREVNLSRGQLSMDFLERLIREKYNYYMYLELLPIYLDRKIPEKNTITKIKKKIYVSVVGSLTRNVKEEMLKYFTEKGIEIMVNEKIVVMMNETDFRSSEKFTEGFREITVMNVDKII